MGGVTEPLSIESSSEFLSETSLVDTRDGIASGETVTAKISGGVAPYSAKFVQKEDSSYEYSDNDTKVSIGKYYIALSVTDDTLSVTSEDDDYGYSDFDGVWEIIITDAVGATLTVYALIEYFSCLTGDTLITMADGTQKRIDEISKGEYVLSIDTNGNYIPAKITYSDSHLYKTHTHYDRFVFSDGTEIKTVKRHRFYNLDRQKFVYLNEWNIGERALKENGDIIELTEIHLKDYVGEVRHYTIFCERNIYFANGVICGNRFSEPFKLKSAQI